jgi:hypothetical protein
VLALTALIMACGTAAQAHDSATNNVTRLPETVVSGRADSLLNIAGSASQGTVGAEQLASRPLQRPGELLETVPGVIITQHSGAGKANQFFSRGFNLDHGTDFSTSLGGVPINLPTHGHGQGYTDLNFIIPELVDTVSYKKGPYYASEGDFSSAGAVNLEYADHLENSFLKLEGGSFNHARAVFASSPHVGQGHLLYGIELFHNDGPWDREDNYRKLNGVVRYSQGDNYQGFSITATAYKGDWDATDQISTTAIEDGLISRWGTLDPTTGGDSQRYGLSAEWHREDDASATKLLAYGFYYDLDLFSNFTYFLDNPVEGDQFEQTDKRGVTGIKASHTLFGTLAERDMENTVGLQLRGDFIENGLHNTTARQRWATTREDNVRQFSLAPYFENKMQWAEKFRTVAGVRADYYNFHVNSLDDINSGSADDLIASPKLSLIFGPWAQTELYRMAASASTAMTGAAPRRRWIRSIRWCRATARRSARGPRWCRVCTARWPFGGWISIPSCSSSAMRATPRRAARAAATAWKWRTTTRSPTGSRWTSTCPSRIPSSAMKRRKATTSPAPSRASWPRAFPCMT